MTKTITTPITFCDGCNPHQGGAPGEAFILCDSETAIESWEWRRIANEICCPECAAVANDVRIMNETDIPY